MMVVLGPFKWQIFPNFWKNSFITSICCTVALHRPMLCHDTWQKANHFPCQNGFMNSGLRLDTGISEVMQYHRNEVITILSRGTKGKVTPNWKYKESKLGRESVKDKEFYKPILTLPKS